MSEIEQTIKDQLGHAYYNGLDKKGWSQFEEDDAVKKIIAALYPTHPVDGKLREQIDKILAEHWSDLRVVESGSPGTRTSAHRKARHKLETAIAAHLQAAVREKADFTKSCKPWKRELRYEAAIRAVQKLPDNAELGKDYSLTDFGIIVCDELQELLNDR